MEKKELAKTEFTFGFEALITAQYQEATKYFDNYLEIVNPHDNLAKGLLDKTLKFNDLKLTSDDVKNELTICL